MDNEIRAERCKGGMVEAVQEGRYVWKAPIGYINGRIAGKPNIVLNPDKELVAKVRSIWEMIDAGMSPEQARTKVNSTGLSELWGKPIGKSHSYKILDNALYKGVIKKFGVEIVSGSITPLVDPSLFDRVQDKLHNKKKSGFKYMKLHPDYPLRGILRCRHGHHITGSVANGNGGRYNYYHCQSCKGGNNYFRADVVHNKFFALLDNLEYETEW